MKQTRVEYVCDLHADEKDVRSLQFGIDGIDYAIDVCSEAEQELRDALQPYADSARRLRSDGTTPKRRRKTIIPTTNGADGGGNGHGGSIPAVQFAEPGTFNAAGYKLISLDHSPPAKVVRSWWKTNQRAQRLPAWRANGAIPLLVTQAYNATHAGH